jgi:hypothetical protein
VAELALTVINREEKNMPAGLRPLCIALLFVLLASSVVSELVYLHEGKEEHVPLVQLWYEGHWKEVRKAKICQRGVFFFAPFGFPELIADVGLLDDLFALLKMEPITGPITWNSHGDLQGKIVMAKTALGHEALARRVSKAGALAVLFIRPGKFPPGFAMYLVDGSERESITIPVMEATFPPGMHLDKLVDGSVIHASPTPNLHKKAADTRFQLVLNFIQSFWELAIMVLGSYRIYQFYFIANMPAFSVAPICCCFEVVAASLRFAYTIVDPFFAYRMLSEVASNTLITISFPFSETAGILLTFFCTSFFIFIFLVFFGFPVSVSVPQWTLICILNLDLLTLGGLFFFSSLFWFFFFWFLSTGAETLSKSNVRAVPFISAYKWASIATVIGLFLIEIICSALRAILKDSPVSPIFISIAIYLITATALIVCYITCAVAIAKRIGAFGGQGRKGKIRTMSLRIALSSGGYVIVVISIIMFAIFSQRVWGRSMTLNSVFIGLNLAGFMQVFALKPVKTSASSTKSNSTGTGGLQSSSGQDSLH